MDGGVAHARRVTLSGGDAAASAIGTLRAAAALENLLVLTYAALVDLPVVRSADGGLAATLMTFRNHHAQHAAAFNAAAVRRGGTAQVEPDPDLLQTVRATEPGLSSIAAAVALAVRVETVAAEARLRDAAEVGAADLRALFVAVAAVEAEHTGALRTSGVLLAAGLPSMATDLTALPASAGTAGLAAPSTGASEPPAAGSAG